MKKKRSLPLAFVLAFGVGAALGVALDDMSAGIALGAAAFVAFATAGRGRDDEC